MRSMLKLLGLVAVLLMVCLPAQAADEKSGTFFDGKSLTGWEGLTKYWAVKGGAIVGSHDGLRFNTFLCSKKKYGDFELTFQIRLKGGKGNSGVQIRSEIFNMERFAVKGPQCDIGGGFWGSLYGEHIGGMMQAAPKALLKTIKTTEFNDYHIKCVGKHVTIKINGKTMVDGDFPKMNKTGIIAWQLHSGGPMEVTFRKIEFKDLSKK